MKRSLVVFLIFSIWMIFMGCGGSPKVRKAESVVDSPDIHYNRGVNLLQKGNFDDAMFEFNQAKSLDPKYAPAYEGMAWVHLERSQLTQGKAAADKSLDLDGKWVLAKVVRARIKGKQGDHQGAIKEAKGAVKNVPKSSVPDKKRAGLEANLALGDIYWQADINRYYVDSQAAFQTALEIDGLDKRAQNALSDLASYRTAVTGQSPELKKIAAKKEITRADVAVLFVQELPIDKVFRKAPKAQSGFRPPSQNTMRTTDKVQTGENLPQDVPANHWAKSFIKATLEKGIMETGPDGNFEPDKTVQRAEFAGLIQHFLMKVWNDPKMATKFIGDTSPFSDLRSDAPLFNAVMVVSTRNWMPGNEDGTFDPLGAVPGKDALLVIRKLKADL